VFDGVATITDNYIGSKLFFSDYEESKRAEYLKSKPTDMKSSKSDALLDVEETSPVGPMDDEELDLDNLL
jgi:hypothetical protein